MRGERDATANIDCDAYVIGAGVAGLYAHYRLRELGLSVRGCEGAPGIGGVWYWNRYPGARFDSESYTYCYSFSEELLADWDWQERFAAQPEVLAYLEHVADRFDLRRAIDFETRVLAARYGEDDASWTIETDRGTLIRTRWLVSAAGVLNVPQYPDIPGRDDFAGEILHTARWPHEGMSLAGKRVGVVGTAATGVQVIQTIAAEVSSLVVFQRTANWCMPQRNSPLDDAERREIKRDYAAILNRCRGSFGGFIHDFDPRSGLAVSDEERRATFEALWNRPGFAFWLGNFADLMIDATVNRHACDFLAGKIRERVRDPETAHRLIPDHPIGTKRVPLENGYYEVFNRDNVRLVDLRETPIERITPAGIRTTAGEHELDVIVFATGFDAITGSLARIDIRGEGSVSLRERWRDGPTTCLGIQVAGFPNLFAVAGPHSATAFCNAVRCTEQNVDWIADCIAYMRDRGYRRVGATVAAEASWMRHVEEAVQQTLLAGMTDSWFFGANTPGKPRRIAIYPPGFAAWRDRCDEVARDGYLGFEFR